MPTSVHKGKVKSPARPESVVPSCILAWHHIGRVRHIVNRATRVLLSKVIECTVADVL